MPLPAVVLPSVEEWALIIASLSLFIAGLSLLWNIINAIRVDRARLRAELDFVLLSEGSEMRRVARLTATNVGKRSVELTSLWLAYGRPWSWWGRLLPKSLRSKFFSVGILMLGDDPYLAALATSLPTRLDVGGQAQVFYETDLVFEKGTENDCKWAYARAGGTTASASSTPHRLRDIET